MKSTQERQDMQTGLQKEYLKTRPLCKVTFTFPEEAASGAKKVNLVGEFGDWEREALPMKRHRDGSFTVTVKLEKGRAYRFRYLVDDVRWENDGYADGYERNPFGEDDSVVTV